jgi:murein DD-endopeptidase MepM/ murein hydrolase activator NlpD
VLTSICCLLPLPLASGLDHAVVGPTAVHVVAKGETLYRISRELGVPVSVLQAHNRIDDPTSLAPGTRLLVPRTHTVAAGETLYAIGRRYRVSAEQILAANAIDDPTNIAIGTLLLLPAAAAEVTAPQPAGAVVTALTVDASNTAAAASARGQELRMWPVPGPRRTLTGKLTGTIIESEEGAAVMSVSSGTVRWASVSRGYGRVIFVQNPLGYIFGYLGIADSFVDVGDQVQPGTEIARLGRNPHDNAANLYFLVFKDGAPIDPVDAPRV